MAETVIKIDLSETFSRLLSERLKSEFIRRVLEVRGAKRLAHQNCRCVPLIKMATQEELEKYRTMKIDGLHAEHLITMEEFNVLPGPTQMYLQTSPYWEYTGYSYRRKS